jgi:ethanolamine transporter EutH
MDPVTALGVTCNALQLFETKWKLVPGCQSIYRSEHGASEQSRMLEAIADVILHLSDAIVLNDAFSRPLQELGRLSKQVASEML